jgi:1,2-phenylacetyl-CoA epoxidase catalytic subunit
MLPGAEATLAAAHVRYVLRLADTSLILGQRLGEWVGHAPQLEEDLGLANLALDLIGQARLLLSHAGELEGRGRDEDTLAFLRDAPEFVNLAGISATRSCASGSPTPGSWCCTGPWWSLRTRAWPPSPPRP